jgi:hypothetical protein
LATYKNARSWELPWGEYPDGVMEPEMIESFHRQASMMGVDLRIVYVNTTDFSQPPYVSELKLIKYVTIKFKQFNLKNMDKNVIKQALIKLEKHHIDEAEMKYEEFLLGNLIDREETVDDDDQSHHRQSIEISDQLEDQAHVHIDHLNAINRISFDPTEVVKPGAIVSVNGRCMIVAVPKAPFTIDGRSFIGISVAAPIYKCLDGKRAGDTFEFNNTKFTIEVVN